MTPKQLLGLFVVVSVVVVAVWLKKAPSSGILEEKDDARLLERLLTPLTPEERKKLAKAPSVEELPWHQYTKADVGSEETFLWLWPTESDRVTSTYGLRRGRMHKGVDIGVPRGAAVFAAASGRVVHSGWIRGYGKAVILYHGGGISSLYAHLDQIAVPSLGFISEGSPVGYAGDTGRATGVHVHFEVRRNGKPVDPMQLRYQDSFKDVQVVRIRASDRRD